VTPGIRRKRRARGKPHAEVAARARARTRAGGRDRPASVTRATTRSATASSVQDDDHPPFDREREHRLDEIVVRFVRRGPSRLRRQLGADPSRPAGGRPRRWCSDRNARTNAACVASSASCASAVTAYAARQTSAQLPARSPRRLRRPGVGAPDDLCGIARHA
jgi:hypothetical protein